MHLVKDLSEIPQPQIDQGRTRGQWQLLHTRCPSLLLATLGDAWRHRGMQLTFPYLWCEVCTTTVLLLNKKLEVSSTVLQCWHPPVLSPGRHLAPCCPSLSPVDRNPLSFPKIMSELCLGAIPNLTAYSQVLKVWATSHCKTVLQISP